MNTGATDDLDALARRAARGDAEARRLVFEALYDELHALASRYMRQQPAGHVLQTTALLHEAFVKLLREGTKGWEGVEHLQAIAARAMRQVLIDVARAARRQKRDMGDRARVSVRHVPVTWGKRTIDVLVLDSALERLAHQDAQMHRVAELTLFGGLTAARIGSVLEISERTVERLRKRVRAWLRRELS